MQRKVKLICRRRMKLRSLWMCSLVFTCIVILLLHLDKIQHMIRLETQHYAQRPAGTSDFVWTNLTENWKLFSAYIDNRIVSGAFGVYKKSLVAMGYEKEQLNSEIQCVVIWSDSSKTILKENAFRLCIAETWMKRTKDYRAHFYRCNLTGITKVPRYVTLIKKNAIGLESISKSQFIPVVDPYSELLHEFGVCYETPLNGNGYKQIVVDSFEMNRLLGATWFTLYIHDGPQWTLDVLKSYTKQGILDGVYNWGVNAPKPTHTFGLIVGIHDCLYRNMHKVKYLAFCDMDEVLTPLKHLNWHDLIQEIDNEKKVFFSFHHVAFHTNHSSAAIHFNCPGNENKVYKLPHHLATKNRSVNVLPKWRNAKSILKPMYNAVIHVHNHIMYVRPGYYHLILPQDLGLLQHFRIKDDRHYRNYNSTIDHSMDRFKTSLLREVMKKMCS